MYLQQRSHSCTGKGVQSANLSFPSTQAATVTHQDFNFSPTKLLQMEVTVTYNMNFYVFCFSLWHKNKHKIAFHHTWLRKQCWFVFLVNSCLEHLGDRRTSARSQLCCRSCSVNLGSIVVQVSNPILRLCAHVIGVGNVQTWLGLNDLLILAKYFFWWR